jgi:tetratricopeptide (TPR) repeat protein
MRRGARLVLAGFVLFGVGLGLLAPYAWSQYQLQAAERALQRYDLDAARDHLQRCLWNWPGNSRCLFLAAQTARRLDDYAQAERLLTDYERCRGVTEEGKLEWLLLGLQQGDLAGQVRYLQGLVDAEHPAAPLILEALAKGFLNVSRGPDMLVCVNRLLKTEPTNVPALILRGEGWEGLHQTERAVEDYQRAVTLNPMSSEGRLHLAEAFDRAGRVREATAHFEFLRQIEPSNPAVLLGLAHCRFEAHELDQAQELLDTLLAAQPDYVAALVERGRLALCRGQAAEAAEKLSRAAALAPWHREAHRLLDRSLETLGDSARREQCRAQLRELEASDAEEGRLTLRYRNAPKDASARLEIAKWALRNGRETEGIRWLFAALLVEPRHGPTHAALADYFERTGQPRRSAEHRRLASAPGRRQGDKETRRQGDNGGRMGVGSS